MPQFEPQIWDCARLWIDRYGPQARGEAINRAREFEANGVNGIAWRRVAEAIEYLDGEGPPTRK